ncbi:MAG TPA: hydrolase, partial [Firmicutes bacterium]|nr:hydrolase [Bacillota bacterium]
VITEGAERMGMDLNEVIKETIAGMRTVAAEIGLKGNL